MSNKTSKKATPAVAGNQLATVPAQPLAAVIAPPALATVGDAKRVAQCVTLDSYGIGAITNGTMAQAITTDDLREYIAEGSLSFDNGLDRMAATLFALGVERVTPDIMKAAKEQAIAAGGNPDTVKKLAGYVRRGMPMRLRYRRVNPDKALLPIGEAMVLAAALEPAIMAKGEVPLADSAKDKLLLAVAAQKPGSVNPSGKPLAEWIALQRASGEVPQTAGGSAAHRVVPALESPKPEVAAEGADVRGSAYLVITPGGESLAVIVAGGKLIVRMPDGTLGSPISPLEAAETLPTLTKALADAVERRRQKIDKAVANPKPLHEEVTEKPASKTVNALLAGAGKKG